MGCYLLPLSVSAEAWNCRAARTLLRHSVMGCKCPRQQLNPPVTTSHWLANASVAGRGSLGHLGLDSDSALLHTQSSPEGGRRLVQARPGRSHTVVTVKQEEEVTWSSFLSLCIRQGCNVLSAGASPVTKTRVCATGCEVCGLQKQMWVLRWSAAMALC